MVIFISEPNVSTVWTESADKSIESPVVCRRYRSVPHCSQSATLSIKLSAQILQYIVSLLQDTVDQSRGILSLLDTVGQLKGILSLLLGTVEELKGTMPHSQHLAQCLQGTMMISQHLLLLTLLYTLCPKLTMELNLVNRFFMRMHNSINLYLCIRFPKRSAQKMLVLPVTQCPREPVWPSQQRCVTRCQSRTADWSPQPQFVLMYQKNSADRKLFLSLRL